MPTFNRVDSPELPPCARCGAEIGEGEDSLMIFSKTEAEVEAEGGPRSLADLGDLKEAYCEKCSHEIETAHEGHDRLVEAFRKELDSFDT